MTRHRKALISLALCLVSLLAFQEVRHHDFLGYDDDLYLTENPPVLQGLTADGIVWAFSSTHASNWHPLTWLSHMTDVELFGQYPAGHHLSSLLLHCLNAVLLFLALARLTGDHGKSAIVAALFALHPLHVESVAWIAERKDVLCAFFGLVSLASYARYTERKSALWYSVSLGSFAAGLMAKPMLVTWPFVFLLLDAWPLRRLSQAAGSARRCVLEKIPFFLLSAASSVVTLIAQQRGGALESLEYLPFPLRAANAAVSYLRYVGKTLWPSDLSIFYPHPLMWPAWQVVGSVLVLLVVSALALRCLRRMGWLFLGWFWFVGMLVPTIGLVQVGGQSIADRYSYLPLVGLLIVGVWGVAACLERVRGRVPLGVGLAVAVAVACGAATRLQVHHWRNTEAIFEHALVSTDRNHVAHHNLGAALAKRGAVASAVAHFEQALVIRPDFPDAHYNLGTALGKRGNFERALVHLTRAHRLRPEHVDTIFNLASTYEHAGRSEDAIFYFSKLLSVTPDHAAAHDRLGQLWSGQGDTRAAVQHYRTALQLDPGLPRALRHLAWILATTRHDELRDAASALQLASRACAETGYDDPADLDTLAAAYAEAGLFEKAVSTGERAAALAAARGKQAEARDIAVRVARYRQREPYRE